MQITPIEPSDVLLIHPDVHRDDRGFSLESFSAERYADASLEVSFVQHNHSQSRLGTLRGLHIQLVRPQGKLIRATRGEVCSELSIAWDDPAIGIHWPIENPVLSEQDRKGNLLADCPPELLPSYPGQPPA